MKLIMLTFVFLITGFICADDFSENDFESDGDFVEDQDSNFETSGLEKDKLIKCSRDKRKLKHELKKMRKNNSELFRYLQESYNEELAICGDDQKCICNVYPYLLNEIKEKEKEVDDEDDFESDDDPYVNSSNRITPKYNYRNDYQSENSYEVSEGKRSKMAGERDLSIASTLGEVAGWSGGIGLVLLATGIGVYFGEDAFVGSVLMGMGGIGMVFSIPFFISSWSVKSRGERKISQAKEYSFNIVPIISPKEKKYGLALSFNY